VWIGVALIRNGSRDLKSIGGLLGLTFGIVIEMIIRVWPADAKAVLSVLAVHFGEPVTFIRFDSSILRDGSASKFSRGLEHDTRGLGIDSNSCGRDRFCKRLGTQI
jgi:hypothetical protein